MMILPLADALQNCLQNLTSRIAGVDNEQMTGRAMGMGAMLGYGIGAIKEQFRTPKTIKSESNNSSNTSQQSGFSGFVNRTKSVINPIVNLSAEKDYNGNINPIRNVIPKQKENNQAIMPKSNNSNKENISNGNKMTPKSVAKNAVKAGFNVTKTYLDVGARMAEGDFNKSAYKGTNSNKKNSFQDTEYVNRVANSKIEMQKSGEENEFKGKSKE